MKFDWFEAIHRLREILETADRVGRLVGSLFHYRRPITEGDSAVFGFTSTETSFKPHMRYLARECELRLGELEDTFALFYSPDRYADYPVAVGLTDDGSVLVHGMCQTFWTRSAPRAAVVLMEEIDKTSERVKFELQRFDSGKIRGVARCKGRTLAVLTPDLFCEVGAEIVVKLAKADELLRKHGYA